MRDVDLFGQALALTEPWRVKSVDFKPDLGRILISIDFHRGGEFVCPECGAPGRKGYDTEERRWRHLNFFQHEAYIQARVPRINCPKCGIRTVSVPWSRAGSGFTLLFEAFVMALSAHMAVSRIAKRVGEHDGRIWRLIHDYVDRARSWEDYSSLTRIGMDETASRRGRAYITVVADMDRSKVVYVAEDRKSASVLLFAEELESRGGDCGNIQEVSCDMSQAYLSGVAEAFPRARVTLDKFHVMRLVNEAVDEVRRAERAERAELSGSRMIWLKGADKLSKSERLTLDRLSAKRLKTGRAYRMKILFGELYSKPSILEAEDHLRKWLSWASRSRLAPMVRAAGTIRINFAGVVRWYVSRLTNAVLEGINSMIQMAKARARGYRSVRNLIAMAYLLAGKLDFSVTHTK